MSDALSVAATPPPAEAPVPVPPAPAAGDAPPPPAPARADAEARLLAEDRRIQHERAQLRREREEHAKAIEHAKAYQAFIEGYEKDPAAAIKGLGKDPWASVAAILGTEPAAATDENKTALPSHVEKQLEELLAWRQQTEQQAQAAKEAEERAKTEQAQHEAAGAAIEQFAADAPVLAAIAKGNPALRAELVSRYTRESERLKYPADVKEVVVAFEKDFASSLLEGIKTALEVPSVRSQVAAMLGQAAPAPADKPATGIAGTTAATASERPATRQERLRAAARAYVAANRGNGA